MEKGTEPGAVAVHCPCFEEGKKTLQVRDNMSYLGDLVSTLDAFNPIYAKLGLSDYCYR